MPGPQVSRKSLPMNGSLRPIRSAAAVGDPQARYPLDLPRGIGAAPAMLERLGTPWLRERPVHLLTWVRGCSGTGAQPTASPPPFAGGGSTGCRTRAKPKGSSPRTAMTRRM